LVNEKESEMRIRQEIYESKREISLQKE